MGKKNISLVFIHGFGGSLTAWNKVAEYFQKNQFTTLLIDLRGHGESFRPGKLSDYKLKNFCHDIALVIDKEKLTNNIIIGHSFGGAIALLFAGLYKKYSAKLVLIAPAYKNRLIARLIFNRLIKQLLNLIACYGPNIKLKGRNNFSRFYGAGDWNLARIITDMLHTSTKSYIYSFLTAVSLNIESEANNINLPTLIVQGTNDTVMPPIYAKNLAQKIKSAKYIEIKNTDHPIVLNQPDKLSQVVNQFVD